MCYAKYAIYILLIILMMPYFYIRDHRIMTQRRSYIANILKSNSRPYCKIIKVFFTHNNHNIKKVDKFMFANFNKFAKILLLLVI
jgi:hypothetical protein